MDRTETTYETALTLSIVSVIASTLEGSFSVYYGYESGSLTLFGNGLASFIAVISGFGIMGMTMRIRKRSDLSPNDVEKTALRITGVGLYLLTVGLVIVGVYNIFEHRHPDSTLSGIIIAIVTIIIVGLLAWKKIKVGRTLQSSALIADAKSTRITVYTSTMVLIASLLFALTKFVYADSIGAIGLAYFAYIEAKECFEF